MTQRWTQDEDEFLLTYHSVGADMVAEHDLGKPYGSGSRRLIKLTKSGARLEFARMMLHELKFKHLSGRRMFDYEDELSRWENEQQACIEAMNKMGVAIDEAQP